MKIALLCGGPSLERGISLNSARSVLDHLRSNEIEIIPIYLDYKKQAYLVSKAQLYSNTPSDFDYKLQESAKKLNRKKFISTLKKADIVFPVIHGAYGEDGQIQKFLENNKIPYIGSSFESCKIAFDKYTSNQFLKNNGFFTLPSALLKIYKKDHKKIIEDFFRENKITRAIVKPATGGSSIGVFSVSSPEEALKKARLLFSKRMDTRVVIESFAQGKEFTVIILQNKFAMPIAILPTEIETDYQKNQIFDFRKKYLPTRQVTYHCPPRFNDETIEKIQYQAEKIYKLFKMQDFARFDGWVLEDGNIWFSDFNPVSGMEQNSFLFQQASRIDMSHGDLLRFITKRSCERQNIKFPKIDNHVNKDKKQVNVLFGGNTSERQVSLMSGTNVWLKLKKSQKYHPEPYICDLDDNVWHLPYSLTLNHTVEEIIDQAKNTAQVEKQLDKFVWRVKERLALQEGEANEKFFTPEKMSLKQFIAKSKYIFIALHGGKGEDGTLQEILEKAGVGYNGPDSKLSKIAIDKYKTAIALNTIALQDIVHQKQSLQLAKKLLSFSALDLKNYWKILQKELSSKTIIVKPFDDGCSSGIVRLFSANDLTKYMEIIRKKLNRIPSNTFKNQPCPVEMPLCPSHHLLFEKFIETDILRVKANKLKITHKTGWVEMTVGVIGGKRKMLALSPSITISEGEVLSVEEKFQGGTGINLTPPPPELINPEITQKIKNTITLLANEIGLKGYSRIDIFANRNSGKIIVIEINTLPGLTPSTVIYHQALAENPPLYPREFLEKIIATTGY